jgi:enoyl-CoA hydratase
VSAGTQSVRIEHDGVITTIILSRADLSNAVDRDMADALGEAFLGFEKDDTAHVAVLWGEGGTFCAGADLKAIAAGKGNRLSPPGHPRDRLAADAPMGPTRMYLSKPVIAAISGYAVAGGLELALWCDLRVAEKDAVLGVFCRRWGVPLIDGGTIRLPRLIGQSRAMDLILTGRPVGAQEALSMGLVNRIVSVGQARAAAEELAREIAAFPQICLRNDRKSVYQENEPEMGSALAHEFSLGLSTIDSGETREGAAQFSSGSVLKDR